MKRTFPLTIVFLIIAGALIVYYFVMRTDAPFFTDKESSPCAEPLTIRVGGVDERFHITEAEVAELILEVAKTWSTAANSTVIEYDENGEIGVNLVYDKEQRLSDRERQYRDRLADEEFSISAHEREYEHMKRQYDREVQQYDRASEEVQKTIDALNRWVSQKNNAGGFNEQDLEEFEKRKREIDSVKQQLARQESVLKLRAEELNNKVAFLNEKINNKNKLVEEYNRMFTGEREFTQGQYERNAENRNINVFHFIDKDELRLVLAHEMGHALGINHVDNPQSVMYRLMGNQNRPEIQLTTEDSEALQNVCAGHLN